MAAEQTVLQVLPQLPGSNDGVGDYALTLARRLRDDHALVSVFAVAGGTSVTDRDGFRVLSGMRSLSYAPCDHVLLHYANYGYQSRGIPLGLVKIAQERRARIPGRWVTTFHELYASGPPWRSAFWLRPLQVRIAQQMISLSSSCIASNEVIKREILRHDQGKRVRLVPVMSNFGEPAAIAYGRKNPGRWTICGGSGLVERSLQTFRHLHPSIPPEIAPSELEIVGGSATPGIVEQIRLTNEILPTVRLRHHPQIEADAASRILETCSFAWLDYFGSGKAWPGMIFKSGSFAACCAHGVIPIVSHTEPVLAIASDALPGPFFWTADAHQFPDPGTLTDIQNGLHSWYHRNASSHRAAAVYAEELQ
jgi:hypothetical protein